MRRSTQVLIAAFIAVGALGIWLTLPASAQSTAPFVPEAGSWFPPFDGPSNSPTTEAEEEEAAVYDAYLHLLAAADCPSTYPTSGTDPFGDPFEVGDVVHTRMIEACLDRRIVLMTPAVSSALDRLHAFVREIEADVAGPGRTDLSDALVARHAAWLSATDAACTYEAERYLGGVGASLGWLECRARETEAYGRWLEEEAVAIRELSAPTD